MNGFVYDTVNNDKREDRMELDPAVEVAEGTDFFDGGLGPENFLQDCLNAVDDDW